MNTVYLLSGSNLGDKYAYLQQAQNFIAQEVGRVNRVSSIVKSAPWGFEHEEFFLNQVVEVKSESDETTVLKQILLIEEKMGRTRNKSAYEARKIDIDILFFNDKIVESSQLSIPHPLLQKRKFVLVPLNELIPDFIHPKLKQSVDTLLKECEDQSAVEIFAFKNELNGS